MNSSTTLYLDITTGLLFTSGVLSFLSGAFIIATLLFGLSTVSSHLQLAKSSNA